MKINRRSLKAIVLSLGLGVAMLASTSAQAQMINLLDEYYDEMDRNDQSLMNRSGSGSYSVSTEQFGNGTSGPYQISTEQFGNDAPLGSGLFILAAAGAGYALKKRKSNMKK